MMNRPNVVFLTLDTLRADALGCYGYPKAISPNIDKLSRAGIRFDQAITGGSWTQAAFPVMLTSTYASMYGGCLGPLSPERPSPVEALAQHGYTTAAFSTSPLVSRTYGYQRGFAEFVDLHPGETDPGLRRLKGGERLLRLPVTHSVARLLGMRTRPAQLYVSGAKLVDELTSWISGVEGPFFSWAHFMDIHWPYHREETLKSSGEIARAWQDLGHLHRANWNGESVNADQRAHYIDLYEKAVRYTDEQIGRLVEALERQGLLDNTVIVLVSDHGEEFLERGQWGHFETNLHDEILRVPLIIRLPGGTSQRVIQRQVRTLDLMPTILELCDCTPVEGMEGVSLAPLWEGDDQGYSAQVAIGEMWRDHWHIIAVRTEAFKYIWNSRSPDEPRLYALKDDPGERTNVAGKYPQQARHFQELVEAHRRRAAETSLNGSHAEPEMEADMLRRLRDLGYVE